MRSSTRALAMLLGSLFLWGCGASKQVKLVVRPGDDANGRLPFYVLVRSVDDKTYLEESYQTVAGKVMAPDESVLDAEVIFPGVERVIEVSKPEKGTLGVYFLLTHPSGDWKTLVSEPLPDKLELKVEGSRLLRSSK